MGLDQFAYTVPKGVITEDVDFDIPEQHRGDVEELKYWRKHPNLHGFMENLYRLKGGKEEQFNCARVRLELDDLILLKESIKRKRLPQTSGFFFGESWLDHEMPTDLEFCDNAIALLEDYDVFYDSWW